MRIALCCHCESVRVRVGMMFLKVVAQGDGPGVMWRND